jgi:agmatine/peptidylarginine deiminase
MILNTKQDYLNVLAMDSNEGKKALQNLLDSRYAWFNTRITEDTLNLVVDETHRFIENDDTTYTYQEYLEDPQAKIFQLGFTVKVVEELINEG